MTANKLLLDSQIWFVQSDLGANSTVSYIYEDGTRLDDLKVFISHNSENENTSKTNFSKATLTNVILNIPPKQNDSIKLPGDTRWWKVQEWRPKDGMYILDITADRRMK